MSKSPYIGFGTGSVFKKFDELAKTRDLVTNNPHNEYLNIGIQFGLLGLLFFLFMFYNFWQQSNKLDVFYELAVKGLIMAIAIGSLFNSLLMDTTEGHFFAYFMVVLFSHYNFSVKKHKKSSILV
jgi:O-antigen ligase